MCKVFFVFGFLVFAKMSAKVQRMRERKPVGPDLNKYKMRVGPTFHNLQYHPSRPIRQSAFAFGATRKPDENFRGVTDETKHEIKQQRVNREIKSSRKDRMRLAGAARSLRTSGKINATAERHIKKYAR